MLLVHRVLENWLTAAGWRPSLEVVQYITFRSAAASLTAFVSTLLLGPIAIRMLARRCPERVVSDSAPLDAMRQSKQRTPTMGGLFVLASVLVAVAFWGDWSNRFVQMAVVLSVGLTAVGAVDDWIKLTGRGKGLSVRAKFAGQLLVIVPVALVLFVHGSGTAEGLSLALPMRPTLVQLGGWFVPLAVLVMVGATNAVNLTDGLDGLAGGCLVFAGSGLGVLAYLAGHRELADYLSIPSVAGAGELAVASAALVGASLGFLWFNCYPAEVFLGDTGSLPLGGLLGLTAVATGQELLLMVVGGVFVIEAASVLVQVAFYKWKKRRLLLCAPLHHHFQFKGWQEPKIVVRFWIAAALLSILAVASLKMR